MNMRQLRRYHNFQTAWNLYFAARFTSFVVDVSPDKHTPMDDIAHKAALRQLVEPDPVEEAKVEFICIKVKDGSVVDTFDTVEDAKALVEKHARQKKAKLQVMNSLTHDLVLFEEPEFTLGDIAATV